MEQTTREPIANYLRSHRRSSGFSQRELAQILGYLTEIQVSRHERSITIPGLLIAMGYEVMYHERLSELFPGIYRTVETNIEDRLSDMEDDLRQSTAKGRSAAPIARKLEFLWERRNPESI